MKTDLLELQGEVLALKCFLAAVSTLLPLSAQLRLPSAFEVHADLVKDRLCVSGVAGFDRVAASLSARSVGVDRRSVNRPVEIDRRLQGVRATG